MKRGRWDLFQKLQSLAAFHKNGSVALKFVTGQRQKRISVATDVLSACTVPPISGLGAFHK
jgi:hypothetical protein